MSKKIVLLSDSLRLSGAATWIINLHHGLKSSGCEVIHIVTGKKGSMSLPENLNFYHLEIERQPLMRVLRLCRLHKMAPDLYSKVLDNLYSKEIRKLLNRKPGWGNVDMIIKNITAYLPSELRQYPIAATIHQRLSQTWSQKKLQHRVQQPITFCTAVSRSVADDAKKLGIKVDKIIVNPIIPNNIVSQSKAFSPPENLQNYIVFVGSIIETKGVFKLLEAFSLLANCNHQLCFVGAGEALGDLKSLVKSKGLGDQVFFTGFQNNPYPFIAGAKLLVLPSDTEAMPYCIAEATALGVPSLVTDFEGADEFFVDEAIVTRYPEATFTERLAKAMELQLEQQSFKSSKQPVTVKPEVMAAMDAVKVAKSYLNILDGS